LRHIHFIAVAMLCPLFLTSCTTEHEYAASHEQLVDAAIQAITDETRVPASGIKRSEMSEKGISHTILEAPYITYSAIKIDVADTDVHVKVTTDKILWTRHKDFEDRIHEIVALKLRAKSHGDESKPTTLPTKSAAPAPVPLPPPEKK